MIPIIFPADETQFNTNGLFRLTDCISCEVTEERNGIYEVEFTYPITGAHYGEIEEGQIIYTTHDESGEPEPFDIYKRSVPIDGIVTFNACHISYRLRNVILQPFEAASCAAIFAAIPNNVINNCPFTFTTNKEVTANYKLTVPKNVREMLGGSQGSILDVYGTGEYEYKKFAVKLWLHRGKDTDVSIRYGKNLISMTDETDAGDVYNAVVPYWQGMDGVLVTVPGYIVTASDFQPGDVPVPIALDLSMEFEEKPTTQELASMAQSKIDADDVRKGTRSIKVDFVQLWQTEEYKDIKPLERLKLCDTVTVAYGDVSTRQKINRVVYDSLLEKYKEMELGATVQSLADALTSSMKKALTEMMEETDKEISWAVQHATDLITGVNGGYVILRRNNDGQPIELLICDTPDYLTATKVWRWNQNGLGYSSTGYQGPYGTAITNDGHIVGNYVDTGTISSLHNESFWNLSTGEFQTVFDLPSDYRRIRMYDGNLEFYSQAVNSYNSLVASLQIVRNAFINSLPALNVRAAGGSVGFGYIDTNSQGYWNWLILGNDAYTSLTTQAGTWIPRFYLNAVGVTGSLRFYNDSGHDGFDINDIKNMYGRIYCNNSALNLYINKNHSFNLGYEGDDIYPRTIAVQYSFVGNVDDYGMGGPLRIFSSIALRNHLRFYRSINSGQDSEGTGEIYSSVTRVNGVDYPGTAVYVEEGCLLKIVYQDPVDVNKNKVGYLFNGTNDESYPYSGALHRFYGNVYFVNDISAQNVTQRSDARTKNVIEWDDDLDKLIDRLHVVRYEWKEDDGLDHVGLIAQEVEEEMKKLGLEDMIVSERSGEKHINYTEINTLLIRKVQHQQKQINDLEARLERLEKLLEG